MKILLTEDVVGLGDIGETVKVKAGYGRNFLIPNGKALEVETKRGKQAQHRARQLEAKKNHLKTKAEDYKTKIEKASVVLELRVATGGKVFGSATSRDIAASLEKLGFEIDRRRIQLSEPIKKIGTHAVKIKLHADVHAEVNVTVNATSATKEEEELEASSAKKKVEAAVEANAGDSDSEVADAKAEEQEALSELEEE